MKTADVGVLAALRLAYPYNYADLVHTQLDGRFVHRDRYALHLQLAAWCMVVGNLLPVYVDESLVKNALDVLVCAPYLFKTLLLRRVSAEPHGRD